MKPPLHWIRVVWLFILSIILKIIKSLKAFATPDGLYRFTVMPFGLCNAPATFNRLMRIVLDGLCNVRCFLDDILVFNNSWEDHLNTLRLVFDRLESASLTAKPSNTRLGFGSIEYLGFQLGSGNIKPVESKVECILSAHRPRTKKQLRSFLGTVNYYNRFIPSYSTLAAPLHDLTKKSVPNVIPWNDECEVSFNNLKQCLGSNPILKLPDINGQFVLRTDASEVGVGAVLLQRYDNKLFPIHYASRKLNSAERNYAIKERELLAIVWAIKKFGIYPYGREFKIDCDHNSLVYLKSARLKNARLMRWSLALQEFKYSIDHIKGKDNTTADYLSRLE